MVWDYLWLRWAENKPLWSFPEALLSSIGRDVCSKQELGEKDSVMALRCEWELRAQWCCWTAGKGQQPTLPATHLIVWIHGQQNAQLFCCDCFITSYESLTSQHTHLLIDPGQSERLNQFTLRIVHSISCGQMFLHFAHEEQVGMVTCSNCCA